MIISYKYRIMPNKSQSAFLQRHIDDCRFIYNLALETKIFAYKNYKCNLSAYDLINQLPSLKKEHTWLKEINSQSLQQSILSMDISFSRFFKGVTRYPKFKKNQQPHSRLIYLKVFL